MLQSALSRRWPVWVARPPGSINGAIQPNGGASCTRPCSPLRLREVEALQLAELLNDAAGLPSERNQRYSACLGINGVGRGLAFHQRITCKDIIVGTWGNGSFENDDAADFMAGLTEVADLSLVSDALAAVLAAEDYLEAPEACLGIAAAEVVAAAAGRPTAAAQEEEELTEWLARIAPEVSPGLIKQANQALDRIVGKQSELRELWEEADEADAWQATVMALKAKLQG
ncbi:DUF4259 domain-containing protein [Pseudoxanthomonas winnipegensis]|nr:DUF4259 domain-containing protein [Pseudoxanthomonas winnipegensis]